MVETLFFHLLNCSLWEKKADADLFSNQTETLWSGIYQMASQQAVLGVIYDAVTSLPSEVQPPRELRLKWFMMVQRIENNNKLLNQVIESLVEVADKRNFRFLLLKGQGQASFYTNPLHRQSGDIDIFFPSKEDFKLAVEWMREEKVVPSASVKHISFEWHGAQLEFHEDLEEMHYPLANYRIQQFYRRSMNCGYEKLVVGNTVVDGLLPEANMVYMMLHVMNHFIISGIGFRQLYDWGRYVSHHASSIDKDHATRLLKQIGIYEFANAFAQIQICYLGVPSDVIPYHYKESGIATWLIEDILKGGNFGSHHAGDKRPKGKWKGKKHTALKMIGRARRFYRVSPTETCWFPFHYAWCNLKMLVNG